MLVPTPETAVWVQSGKLTLKVADRYVILKQGELIDEGNAKAAGAVDSMFEHLRV